MKYINKRIQNEPTTLRDYRTTTPNASYDGFVDKDRKLKKALLAEQGYLCGYCMKGIHKPEECSVEHYISQQKHLNSPHSEKYHKDRQLIYNNMIAVCINNGEHCDKSRSNEPFRVLNPHHRSCEHLVTYTLNGEIVGNNPNAATDVELLKLNCQTVHELREHYWEKAKDKLKRKHPRGDWNKKILQQEIDEYSSMNNQRFYPYCNYVVFRFQKMMELPRYAK